MRRTACLMMAVVCVCRIKDNWRDHGLMSGLMDRLFIVIDTNGTKHVDFGEFLVAANILLKGSQDDRLQFCFMFADANDDHLISRYEIWATEPAPGGVVTARRVQG